jgi:hypothetical protein
MTDHINSGFAMVDQPQRRFARRRSEPWPWPPEIHGTGQPPIMKANQVDSLLELASERITYRRSHATLVFVPYELSDTIHIRGWKKQYLELCSKLVLLIQPLATRCCGQQQAL